MNRRGFGVAVVVLLVTVVLFGYRQHQRDAEQRTLIPPKLLPSSPPPLEQMAEPPLQQPVGQSVSQSFKQLRQVSAFRRKDVVVSGGWGSGPGQFGHKRVLDALPEGPLALSVASDGSVLILDQVNRRLLRFRDGRAVSSIPLGQDSAQDLALGPEGRLVVLDRLLERGVQIYSAEGELLHEVSLAGKLELGGLTGVFVDEHGIYLERDHGLVQRSADLDGQRSDSERDLVGRPSRDGQLAISAALLDPQSGQLTVRAHDRVKGQSLWQRVIQLPQPILQLVMIDSDRAGRIYLAAVTAIEEQTPPYRLSEEALYVMQLGRDGNERSRLKLPPLHGSDESYRPVTVDDGGNLYVLSTTENGVTVTRYVFP